MSTSEDAAARSASRLRDWAARAVVVVPLAPRYLAILLLRTYQVTISPMLGPVCRFAPSCSSYAVEAYRIHGTIRGSWMTARRLLRCHPWNPGGYDPVPPRARHGHSDQPFADDPAVRGRLGVRTR